MSDVIDFNDPGVIMLRLENALKNCSAESADPYGLEQNAKTATRTVPGGRVLFFPSADGVVRIIGLGAHDEWLAEFSCLASDFREEFVQRMERHVARKAGVHMTLVG